MSKLNSAVYRNTCVVVYVKVVMKYPKLLLLFEKQEPVAQAIEFLARKLTT